MNNSINITDPHRDQPVFHYGAKLEDTETVMIMIHGRGATAQSILSLANEFKVNSIAFIAPQAENYTWYPYSFLSPIEKNEPGITSGLNKIDIIVNDLLEKSFSSEKIFLLGFSQGACLSLEYAAHNPKKFGGIFGLSGGLIGPPGTKWNYNGDFNGTEIFLGCSDIDPHIPLERVNETENAFKLMNSNVTKRIYKGMGHTINQNEIDFIIKSLINKKTKK